MSADIFHGSVITQVRLLLVGYHSEAWYWSVSSTDWLTSEVRNRKSNWLVKVFNEASYCLSQLDRKGLKPVMEATCYLAQNNLFPTHVRTVLFLSLKIVLERTKKVREIVEATHGIKKC